MAATPSLLIKAQMSFKGNTQVWSTRHHFLGGTPASGSAWHTLMDNVTTALAAALTNNSTIIEAVGYLAGSNVGAASKSYSLVGTYSGSGGAFACPEDAALLRYSTAARTTKNHPVYLFNYLHGPYVSAGGSGSLVGSYQNACRDFMKLWIGSANGGTGSGFSDGANNYLRAGPNGAAATGWAVPQYATIRDFPG